MMKHKEAKPFMRDYIQMVSHRNQEIRDYIRYELQLIYADCKADILNKCAFKQAENNLVHKFIEMRRLL